MGSRHALHPGAVTAGVLLLSMAGILYALASPGQEPQPALNKTLLHHTSASHRRALASPIPPPNLRGAIVAADRALPESDQRLKPAGSEEDALRVALLSLADALRSETFDRYEWETRVAAYADSLGDRAANALQRVVRGRRMELVERVAATELLRALSGKSGLDVGPLPVEVLEELRAATRDGSSPAVRTAAGRSLAALGGPSDLLQLCEQMAMDLDGHNRDLASWALGAAQKPALFVALGQVLSGLPGAEVVERCLCTLSANAVEQTDTLDPWARRTIAHNARQVLGDQASGHEARIRSLSVLSALAPEAAREDIIDLLIASGEHPRLRRLAGESLMSTNNPQAARDASLLLSAPNLPHESRIALAEAIVKRPGPDSPGLKERARDTLEEALALGGTRIEQRRLRHALGRAHSVLR